MINRFYINIVSKGAYTRSVIEIIKIKDIIFVIFILNRFDKYIEMALIEWDITVIYKVIIIKPKI